MLAQFINTSASMPLPAHAGSRLVQTLQSHVSHHDGGLFDFLDRTGIRPERPADNGTAAEWLPGLIRQGAEPQLLRGCTDRMDIMAGSR
jgi:hypothetical protein